MAGSRVYLSNRGTVFANPSSKLPLMNFMGDLWHETLNPAGYLSLGVSENTLMHAELINYFKNKGSLNSHALTYGDGFSGSHRLRNVVATFVNRKFSPAAPVLPQHVAVTSGVGPALESFGFAICDPGQGILLGRPFSGSLPSDLGLRANVATVPVSFGEVDPFCLDAINNYEAALEEAREQGIPVKALLLCSPHNPLGRCFTREVLIAYMRFCQKHRLHLISDEIYALSVWHNADYPDAPGFTSVLSIDTEGLIDPSLVHVMWGMSKDFGANGIRVGYVISQGNQPLLDSLGSQSYFTCPSAFADRASADLLADADFIDNFITTSNLRLAHNYKLTTRFLDLNNIPYHRGSNAGFFVWVDLFTLAAAAAASVNSYRCLRQASDASIENLRFHEAELEKVLLEHRIFLSTGKTFGTETPGWFRIAFAHDEAYLLEGLERMLKATKAFGTHVALQQKTKEHLVTGTTVIQEARSAGSPLITS